MSATCDPAALLAQAECLGCLSQRQLQRIAVYLGCQVANNGFGDPAVKSFIARAGISDATQISAITALVSALKSSNIWGKFAAIYPFVGGNASAHSQNLASSSYPITWHGTVTHDATGITGNGSTGYGNCAGLSNTTVGVLAGLAVYSRAIGSGTFTSYTDLSGATIPTGFRIVQEWTIGSGDLQFQTGNVQPQKNTPFSAGLYAGDKSATARADLYINGVSAANSTTSDTYAPTATEIFVLANNNAGTPNGFSNHNLAFAAVFTSMSAAEHATFYAAVQAYETALGRQV